MSGVRARDAHAVSPRTVDELTHSATFSAWFTRCNCLVLLRLLRPLALCSWSSSPLCRNATTMDVDLTPLRVAGIVPWGDRAEPRTPWRSGSLLNYPVPLSTRTQLE